MRPRPILLVREPLSTGQPMHADFAKFLTTEGYIVGRCDPVSMHDFHLVAEVPFTQADVEFLRGGEIQPHPAADPETVQAFLESLAARIAGMLAKEALVPELPALEKETRDIDPDMEVNRG